MMINWQVSGFIPAAGAFGEPAGATLALGYFPPGVLGLRFI
jgi:hypothetical protein